MPSPRKKSALSGPEVAGEAAPSRTLTLTATAFNVPQVNDHVIELTAIHEAQLAFAGRSNVGKSSLLNALAARKNLARTSATPGKTRSVNFYRVTPGDFTLTDLPGYGYARCSQEERKFWARLIEHYLSTTPDLKGLVLLLDCRLDPQALDRDLADYARTRNIPLLPVLTKADKCKQAEQAVRRKQWAALLDGQMPLVVSSATRRGIGPLWDALLRLVAENDEAVPDQSADNEAADNESAGNDAVLPSERQLNQE